MVKQHIAQWVRPLTRETEVAFFRRGFPVVRFNRPGNYGLGFSSVWTKALARLRPTARFHLQLSPQYTEVTAWGHPIMERAETVALFSANASLVSRLAAWPGITNVEGLAVFTREKGLETICRELLEPKVGLLSVRDERSR